MTSNLALRTLSALILAPLVLGAVWYGGSVYETYAIPLYTILLALFGTGLAWEWENMIAKKTSTAGIWMAMLACFTAFLTPDNPQFALWVILLGATIVYWKSGHRLAIAAGVLYICIPLMSLSYIYYINDKISRELVLWLFFVVWATDVGGYVVGSLVKGPKICPAISAHKTWSGFFGGVLFASIVAYIFALYLKAYDYLKPDTDLFRRITIVLVLSAAVLAVVSQIGDFFESYIKRRLNLKDSSNIIPGHGGLFDRVDGLLFASTVLAIVLFCMNQGWIFVVNEGWVLE